VVAEFPVRGLAAVHRVGQLEVGEIAVVAAVSCAHRGEAFAACRQLIDEIKATVPIWKHQRFADRRCTGREVAAWGPLPGWRFRWWRL
jgi:molybdopterin synthase catalytic subunit